MYVAYNYHTINFDIFMMNGWTDDELIKNKI